MPYFVVGGQIPGIYTKQEITNVDGSVQKFATLGAAQLYLDCQCGHQGSIAIERVYISATMFGDPTHFVPCCGFGIFFGTNNPYNMAASLDEVDNLEVNLPNMLRSNLWAVFYCLKMIHERLMYKKYRGKSVVYVSSPVIVDIMENSLWKYHFLSDNIDLKQEISAIAKNINSFYSRFGWGDIEFKYIPRNVGHPIVEVANRMAHSGASRMGLYEIR